jgi:predicted acylesterase/phospholipase RssA
MKKIVIPIILGIFIVALMIYLISLEHPVGEPEVTGARNGVAIIMTGAAARIPQEAALLEELDHRGLLKNVVFISGVSSGALNAVVLNGILSEKMTWSEYKDILYNLKNNDVFIQDEKKIPVSTAPARALFKKVVEERLGYHSIGDLPVMTEISITEMKVLDMKSHVYRMCSRKINVETDTALSLVDILMASTAFPVVFPKVRIDHVKTIPDCEFIDGGVGDDHVPFQALLDFEKFRGSGVEKVYIVSRKADSLPEISEELKGLGLEDNGLFDNLGISLDAILERGLIKRLEAFATEAPELVPLTDVWIPDFQADFLMFNFDHLKEQYELTSQWAKTHNPLPLEEFLSANGQKFREH